MSWKNNKFIGIVILVFLVFSIFVILSWQKGYISLPWQNNAKQTKIQSTQNNTAVLLDEKVNNYTEPVKSNKISKDFISKVLVQKDIPVVKKKNIQKEITIKDILPLLKKLSLALESLANELVIFRDSYINDVLLNTHI